MTPTHLQQWIQHPETLNRDTLYELRTLVARYPYFQSLRLLYLKTSICCTTSTWRGAAQGCVVCGRPSCVVLLYRG